MLEKLFLSAPLLALAGGDIVLAPTGWRTHAASAGTALRKLDPATAQAASQCLDVWHEQLPGNHLPNERFRGHV